MFKIRENNGLVRAYWVDALLKSCKMLKKAWWKNQFIIEQTNFWQFAAKKWSIVEHYLMLKKYINILIF